MTARKRTWMETISVMLPTEVVEEIDKERGLIPRSIYLRDIIMKRHKAEAKTS